MNNGALDLVDLINDTNDVAIRRRVTERALEEIDRFVDFRKISFGDANRFIPIYARGTSHSGGLLKYRKVDEALRRKEPEFNEEQWLELIGQT